MKNIFIVAEGVSEEHFAKKILCPHFLDFNKNIIPITVLTKKDNRHGAIHKGGITTYRKFQNTLHPILKAIPIYDKTVAGVEILHKIGLNQIRQKCKHFNDWITHLEQL